MNKFVDTAKLVLNINEKITTIETRLSKLEDRERASIIESERVKTILECLPDRLDDKFKIVEANLRIMIESK